MKHLLLKELKLSLHPTVIVFLILSSMLLIPNYPYLVVFFYTSLGIFFTCLLGRENKDVEYTALLPVAKSDIVTSRVITIVIIELFQIIFAIPFAILRSKMPLPPNEVGLDANISLFAMAFILCGIFNIVFLSLYYKNVTKVGTAFNFSCGTSFLFIIIVETLTHIDGFFKDVLDTPDSQFLFQKLIVLAISILIFCILTITAYNISKARFEKFDL